MPWDLSEGQLAVIAEHVRGRRVADYGASNLEKAHQLAQLGAAEVIAVDKERSPRSVTDPRVTVVGPADRDGRTNLDCFDGPQTRNSQ